MPAKIFDNWRGDVLGGIMTAVVALPVAMAFGVASGLGAAAGLYGAMTCGFFAAIFGGTRGQQSGPTGPIAVIVASLLVANNERIEIVIAATILAGLMQIVFGRFGFGDLVRYVPYPVVSGFMTGIALIIILLHINPLVGIKGSKEILKSIQDIPDVPAKASLIALAIGLLTLVLLYGIKAKWKRAPAALIALIVTTVTSVLLKLDIPRIGHIPGELPLPSLPAISAADLSTVLIGGLTIAVLGSVDSLLTSLIADKLVNDHHDSNKELVGQGIGNVVTGLLGGLAGSGSTTRTIANIDAGGRTALSGVVYGALVLGVITCLGSVASVVPLSALAAILIALGIGIIDWRMLRHIKAAPRSDIAVMFVVLVMTVAVDLISAVLIGTAIACVLFVKKISDARLSECGTASNFKELEHIMENLPATVVQSVFVYTFNGPMFFGETKNLIAAVKDLGDHKIVVFNFEFAPFIDQTCAYFLEDTIANLRDQGIYVIVLGLKTEVRKLLEALECRSVLNPEHTAERWSNAADMLGSAEPELIGSTS